MSGFRDTFTKNESQEELLGYDDSAFLYFAVTVLTFIVVPWSYTLLTGVLFPEALVEAKHCPSHDRKGRKYKYCEVSTEVEKIKEQKREAAKSSNRFTNSFFIRAAILTALWSVNIHLIINASGVEEMKRFDPFDILNVAKEATEKEIKKAYRKLSLVYHPDKNPDNPTAQTEFIRITKAYATLTDETAKKNYEKYGNPDGPQSMKVGIGLPKFLVEQENKVLILSCFFFVLIILIPGIFIWYYNKQKGYAPNGVLVDTMYRMRYFLKESTRVKNMTEILALSGESEKLSLRPTDNTQMQLITRHVQQHIKSQVNRPIMVRNHFLILAHMQRLHEYISPELQEDLDTLLKASLLITQSMVEMCTMFEWFGTAQSCLELRRCLVQALDVKSSTLLQIPHFDEEVIKHCSRGKNQASGVLEFFSKDKADRKGLQKMNDQQMLDIEAFEHHLTQLQVDVNVAVEDEEDIVEGDVVTVTVKMTRLNLKEGEAQGPVSAPFLPEPVFEEWWIFLNDATDRKICCHERIRSSEREVESKLRFQAAARPGKHEMFLHLMNDSYAGVDQKIPVTFMVKAEKDVNRDIFVHQEDRDLDLQPSLFEQFVGLQRGDDSEDEEDEEGERSRRAVERDGLSPTKKKGKDDSDSDSSSSSSSDSESDEE